MTDESNILRAGPDNPKKFQEALKRKQSDTVFSKDQHEKKERAEMAAQIVSGIFDDRNRMGSPLSKKELADLAETMLFHYTDYAKGYSWPEIDDYLDTIKSMTGQKPVTTERLRNIERGALKKIRTHPDLDEIKGATGLQENEKLEQSQGRPVAFGAPKFETFQSLEKFLNRHN